MVSGQDSGIEALGSAPPAMGVQTRAPGSPVRPGTVPSGHTCPGVQGYGAGVLATQGRPESPKRRLVGPREDGRLTFIIGWLLILTALSQTLAQDSHWGHEARTPAQGAASQVHTEVEVSELEPRPRRGGRCWSPPAPRQTLPGSAKRQLKPPDQHLLFSGELSAPAPPHAQILADAPPHSPEAACTAITGLMPGLQISGSRAERVRVLDSMSWEGNLGQGPSWQHAPGCPL